MSWVNKFSLGKIFLKESSESTQVNIDYRKESGLPVWGSIHAVPVPTCINGGGGSSDIYIECTQESNGTITLDTEGTSTRFMESMYTLSFLGERGFNYGKPKESTMIVHFDFDLLSNIQSHMSYSDIKNRLNLYGGVTVLMNGGTLVNLNYTRYTTMEGVFNISGGTVISNYASARKKNGYWGIHIYACVLVSNYNSHEVGGIFKYTRQQTNATMSENSIRVLFSGNLDRDLIHHTLQKQLVILEKI